MQDISLYHTVATRYHHLRSIRTIKMMNTISHQIERQISRYQMPVEFYAGFQRMSYFLPQRQRYERLASVCRCIYVFGVADIQPPSIPGIEFIELSLETSMAREWFLLVDTPEFWTLLTTYEVSEQAPTGMSRQFDGLWTFDAPVVETASHLLRDALGQPHKPLYERYSMLQSQNVLDVTECLIEDLSC